MRAVGALYSKVNLPKKKRQAAARAGGLVEDGAVARVDNRGEYQNTRDVLVSLTQEGQVEELGRRRGQGQGRGTTSGKGRAGDQSRVRGGRGGRGGAIARTRGIVAGQEGQGGEARRGGRGGQGSSTGRGRNSEQNRGSGGRGGRGRGWVQSGDNRRRCLECNGEYSDRYIYHHLRELCPGRTQDESSEEEAVALEAEEDDVELEEHGNVNNFLQEVSELEISVFERNTDSEDRRRNVRGEAERKRKEDARRIEEERRKKRPQRFLSGSSSSSSASPVQQPPRQRRRAAASSPPSSPRPAPPVTTAPPALSSPPSPSPERSPYHMDLGPQLTLRRTAGQLDLPDASADTSALARAGDFTLVTFHQLFHACHLLSVHGPGTRPDPWKIRAEAAKAQLLHLPHPSTPFSNYSSCPTSR